MTDGRCADLSSAGGESLAATATTARDWLLVEVRGTWPRDVSEGAALGESARTRITAWLDETPSSRLLFIRRPGRARERPLVFVVRATEHEAAVRRIELDETRDLGDVDLRADGEPVDGALVLVCGHGTRDTCCALHGSAVYGALGSLVPGDALWLSSHQGGHRFAANVLVLPGGIQLGRVRPEDATTIVGDALAGRIPLEHYRGRTAYSAREQAAELAVREAHGSRSLSDVEVLGDDGTYVRLVGADGREYHALVEHSIGPSVPASCGAAAEPQRHFRAQLI